MHLIDNLGLGFVTAIIAIILVSFVPSTETALSYWTIVCHDPSFEQPLSTPSLSLPRTSTMGHISHPLCLDSHQRRSNPTHSRVAPAPWSHCPLGSQRTLIHRWPSVVRYLRPSPRPTKLSQKPPLDGPRWRPRPLHSQRQRRRPCTLSPLALPCIFRESIASARTPPPIVHSPPSPATPHPCFVLGISRSRLGAMAQLHYLRHHRRSQPW